MIVANRFRNRTRNETVNWLAGFDSRVGKLGERGNVVADEHSALLRGPRQHRRVVRAAQAGVLNSHQVECGVATQQAAEDVVDVFGPWMEAQR